MRPHFKNPFKNATPTHYSQSSRENAAPFSGSSPFSYYQGIPSECFVFLPERKQKQEEAKKQWIPPYKGYKGFLLLTVGSQLKATHEVHAKKKTESN